VAATASYDPQATAITGAFVATFNAYIRDHLKFAHDRDYHGFANFGDNHWDWTRGTGGGRFPVSPNCMGDLANALIVKGSRTRQYMISPSCLPRRTQRSLETMRQRPRYCHIAVEPLP
jgi:hypothetical protein